MNARDEILQRVRTALGDTPGPALDIERTYRTGGAQAPGDPALVDLLVDRLVDYKAGVRRGRVDQVPSLVAAALRTGLARRAARAPTGSPRLVVPPGLDRAWLSRVDADVTTDDGLDAASLDALDAVVTAATVAIAETGTIVLDGSPDQGRRAITLVPDVHICIVRADQVVATVPDAMTHLEPCRPQTWISGPSATSDIELDRVEGVHGPRTLEVLIIG